MISMMVTEEEKFIIEKAREEKKEKIKKELKKQEMLEIANDYNKWLNENGEVSTFSTFVNSYGYDKENSNIVYRTITNIINAAND